MLLLLAPLLSLVAIAFGGIATIVVAILNGPRRLRRRAEAPLVVLPPVPSPDMLRAIEEERRAGAEGA